MPMSPRLLRPRQTGFTPRSISGLALWLDAADSSTLYTTDAGPVTAVSSPLDIAGCELWFDASDTASITESGGLVSQWNDKSGKGRHATSSGSARPTTGTRTVGGRNALDFNGTSNSMTTSGSAFPTAATHTVFIVYQLDTAAQSRSSVLLTASTITDQEVRVVGYGLSSAEYVFNNNAGTSMTASLLGLGPIVFSAREATKAMRSAGAGVLSSSSGNATAWSSGSMLIGGRPSSNWLDGLICEIAIYNSTLSDTDTARVEAYLAAKWGISGVHAPATATNDPVGAWLDKSGNGRHARQATAASRPSVSASTQNGRRMIGFDGNDAIDGDSPQISQPFSIYAVFQSTDTAASKNLLVGSRSAANASAFTLFSSSSETLAIYAGGSTLSSNGSALATTVAHALVNGASSVLRNRGAIVASGAVGTTAFSPSSEGWRLGRFPTGGGDFFNGSVCEILLYSGSHSALNISRVERYLASKWGITLAPQVSNADAQDWVNRVYQNGGTVSEATASAVNAFCNSIDAAGIRDRFYRLNLFAGNSDASLAAVRTPLFRGPSLTGTQYGNATDTNVNFVAGDYAETGASGGLTGLRTASKRLATGVLGSSMRGHDFHASSYEIAGSDTTYDNSLGAWAATGNQGFYAGQDASVGTWGIDYTNNNIQTIASPYAGHYLAVQSGSRVGAVYKNGSAASSVYTSGSATSDAWTNVAWDVQVFAGQKNSAGTYGEFSSARLGGYSFGLAMTASQAAAYYTAMQSFQTALGRQV